MWKIIFLTLFAVAFAGVSQFHLKGIPRRRLRVSLEEECEKYSHKSTADRTYDAVMTAVGCLYSDSAITDSFSKLSNINSSETFLVAARAVCSQRQKILPCYRTLLEVFTPCAPPSVKQQIENMQTSFEKLAEFVCNDDCRTLRSFIDDGGFDCLDSKDDQLTHCTANMTDLTVDLPEDTTTFAAIDTCFRYDSMVSCLNEELKSCFTKSTSNFFNSLFTQFRQGTYCHVTLPLEKDEDLNKATTEDGSEAVEENKL
ncbi:hypothetical protein ABMA28_015447 [Loxostege sticticalis]|uniref:DUF19 domain-containing protein n=1 Tax=Loxostege sticticalis TaxID=481309 RepID=A0ABD0T9U7_LOXSC